MAQRLRSIRSEKEYSQEEFARHAGMNRSYYGQIERGEKNISIAVVFKICDGLGITPGELLDEAQTWRPE